MVKEINNPLGTQVEEAAIQASPDSAEAVDLEQIGQEGQVEAIETEQAKEGTDNVEVTPQAYKSLQAEFTKKSQRLAELEKQREKELEELEAYRQLYMKQMQQMQQPKEMPQKTAKEFAEMSEMEKFNYLVDQRVSEIVNPHMAKISQLEGILNAMVMENAAKIRNSFFEANPDAIPYEEQIATIMTNHNIKDPQKAWEFFKVQSGLAKNEAKQEVIKEIQVKKDASKLIKPISTPSTPISEKVASFEEAYQKALKELGAK